MQRFLVTPRHGPAKRAASERVASFGEIYEPFQPTAGAEQASRCTQCGVPFCQSACPLENNIPDWLRKATQGDLRAAWREAEKTSAMPEICGRICPQDRLCEGACTLERSGWETVTIGSVESWLGDMAFAEGWVSPLKPAIERDISVGIIGSGPAGLAAADRLRSAGAQVTIYERNDRAGGLLTYGIPGFKLEKHVVQRRLDRLAEGGVSFVLGAEIGRDRSLADLRAEHDAVLIATGVYKAHRLQVPGCGSHGVVAALDYLFASNRKGFGDAVEAFDSGELNASGKRVVVIGGGDTAMDCVRTAVRQGARSVTCVYRRDRANMPGSAREVANAEEEGVRFEWMAAPKAVLGGADGVVGLRASRTVLAAPTLDGRWEVEVAPDSDFEIPADMVIEALGFAPENLPTAMGSPDLAVDGAGRVQTARRSAHTSLPGVFAAGDIVRGASLVVWAVRQGQDAATEILDWIDAEKAAAA